MPKYIKAVDAADKFSEISGTPLCELIDIMCAIPAADVAQVVRCKDCRWWNRKYTTVGKCEKLADRDQEGGAQFDCDTDDDDFCSYGERKDGAE